MARVSGTGKLQAKALRHLRDGHSHTTREVAAAIFGRVTKQRATAVRRALRGLASIGKVIAEPGVRPQLWTLADLPRSKKKRPPRRDESPDQGEIKF